VNSNYWIYHWAKFRQDEVIRVPKDYTVHEDFTRLAGEAEVRSAFSQINALYAQIYGDIAEKPGEFGMPMHLVKEQREMSQKWRDCGQAVFRPFVLLYNLFVVSQVENRDCLCVPIEKYNALKKQAKYHVVQVLDSNVKNAQDIFVKLADYGFVFEGLKNNKPSTGDIIISYPDNPFILQLWKMLADKMQNTCGFSGAGYSDISDFIFCSFRLLQDGLHTANYGDFELLYDYVLTETEKAFVLAMDEKLMGMGLFRRVHGGFECRGLAYYHSEKVMEAKGPYTYRMVSRGGDFIKNINVAEKMRMQLRIRNVTKCLEYLESCPEAVKQIFEKSDKGCKKRVEGTCVHGISYEINGEECWRCGCCHTSFSFAPKIEDIEHYIKLVELGEKK